MDAARADDVEIALGVYVHRVLRRWWIVAAAVIIAVAIAVVGSSGGHTTYRAQTLINLGTPYTALGGAPITSAFCTSPIAPSTLIRQDSIRAAAERAAGLKPGALDGHASAQPVAGAITKLNFTPAVSIVVQGSFTGQKTARAADELAKGVQTACGQYALKREATTQRRLARELKEQADLNRRLAQAQTLLNKVQADRALSATNQLLAATVAGNTLSNITQRQNQLDLFIGEDESLLQQVRYVELTQIITPARATKVTAGGGSASLGVAIVLGALVGIALALVSYAVGPTRRRET